MAVESVHQVGQVGDLRAVHVVRGEIGDRTAAVVVVMTPGRSAVASVGQQPETGFAGQRALLVVQVEQGLQLWVVARPDPGSG